MNCLYEHVGKYVPLEHALIRRIYENAGIPEADIDARAEFLSRQVLGGVLDNEDRLHLIGLAAVHGNVFVLNRLERMTVDFCSDDVGI